MFDNILHEVPHVEKIYTEALNYVNIYRNFNRQSVFCRYYNVNLAASTYNNSTASTFDRYESGIMYDVYDLTPIYTMNTLINDSNNDNTMFGQIFDGQTSITTYTITEPHIEDIVIFNQKPLDGDEIFRVSTIRASVNAMNSTVGIKWFENTLDYAPLITVDRLNILNRYVYCLPLQKYLFQDDFKLFLSNVEQFNLILKQFENMYFDSYQELYYVIINGDKYFPKYENAILYQFLSTKNQLSDLFLNIKRPYSATYFTDNDIRNDALIDAYRQFCHNKHKRQLSFDSSKIYDIFDICTLIRSWVWYLNYDKYPTPDLDVPITDVEINVPMFTSNGILYKSGPKCNLLIDVRQLTRNIIERQYGL